MGERPGGRHIESTLPVDVALDRLRFATYRELKHILEQDIDKTEAEHYRKLMVDLLNAEKPEQVIQVLCDDFLFGYEDASAYGIITWMFNLFSGRVLHSSFNGEVLKMEKDNDAREGDTT